MAGNDGYAGQAGVAASGADRNVQHFQTKQSLAATRTVVPVKIVAIHGGGVGPDPTLDVQPLINMTDGQGNPTDHGTIYGIAAPRNHTGNGTVINDPVVGDMGYMHVADRDISTFKATNAQANPGSFRRHSLSDGVFTRGHNGTATPKQYVQFRSDGVTVMDVNGNLIETTASKMAVAPKGSGTIVYLGGDGTTGTYDFALTPSGPSINVKVRTG